MHTVFIDAATGSYGELELLHRVELDDAEVSKLDGMSVKARKELALNRGLLVFPLDVDTGNLTAAFAAQREQADKPKAAPAKKAPAKTARSRR